MSSCAAPDYRRCMQLFPIRSRAISSTRTLDHIPYFDRDPLHRFAIQFEARRRRCSPTDSGDEIGIVAVPRNAPSPAVCEHAWPQDGRLRSRGFGLDGKRTSRKIARDQVAATGKFTRPKVWPERFRFTKTEEISASSKYLLVP
jgi:hypothetical protein